LRHITGYLLTVFCATFAYRCTCGFWFMCTPWHNMLTLQERVPISTGNKFQWCVWLFCCWLHVEGHVSGLWVKLTTADRVHNSCTAVLTDCKGVSSHSLFSVLSWWHELPLFLNEEILEGPGYLPHSSWSHSPNVWVSLRPKVKSKTSALLGWGLAPGSSNWGSMLLPAQCLGVHTPQPL
jgi:hypothetical protein